MEDKYKSYRRYSLGWNRDPAAKVHPRISFGPGFYLTEGFVEKHNITHVINCAFDADSPSWFKSRYPERYACIEAEDSLHSNILDWYFEFEDIMRRFLKDRSCKMIYVHCQAGVNRSGFLTLLFACNHFRYDYESCVNCILSQRPCALQNPVYQIQVEKRVTKE